MISLYLSGTISGKMLVFTYAYNQPDFIEIQYKTFKKFLKDEYDFIVFNDAKQKRMAKQITAMCQKYDIRCIRIPQEIHDIPYLDRPTHSSFAQFHLANVRNCNVVQYSLDTVGIHHNDIVALFDSDLFLIKEFSIRQFMEQYTIAGVMRPCSNQWWKHSCQKLHPGIEPFNFLWIGLVFLNTPLLHHKTAINFNCGFVHNNIKLDSGGYTYFYLDGFGTISKHINRIPLNELLCPACKKTFDLKSSCTHNTDSLKNASLTDKAIQLAQTMPLHNKKQGRPIEFLLDGTFLHYQAGSNYQGFSAAYHAKKTKLIQNFIADILSEKGLV